MGIVADLSVHSIESMPFQENTYIAYRTGQAECLVIDPGFEPGKILDVLDQHKLQPKAILNTHGHSDHIAGNAAMKQKWPEIPLIIGHGDADKLTDPVKNLSRPFGGDLISPPADQTVQHGEVIEFASISLEVADTPGHCRGHVVFKYQSATGPVIVFGGDVLFQGSVGRTDFPDGDTQALTNSIHRELFTLPADTIVFPGHGPATTVGAEIQGNPFVGIPAGYRPD